jgi:hypothetical protein
MRPAIPLPAIFRFISTNRTILAEADYRQLRVRNPHRAKKFFRSLRPSVSQRHVVFFRPALVAMPFDQQLLARIVRQNVADHRHVGGQRRPRIVADGALVVIEQRIFQPGQLLIQRRPFLRRHGRRTGRLSGAWRWRSSRAGGPRRRLCVARGRRHGCCIRRTSGGDRRCLMAPGRCKYYCETQKGQSCFIHQCLLSVFQSSAQSFVRIIPRLSRIGRFQQSC